MIFLEEQSNNTDLLIGHVRICLLPNNPVACWVESIIIAKERRNRGLGKLLMHFLEIELKKQNFKKVLLYIKHLFEHRYRFVFPPKKKLSFIANVVMIYALRL